MSIFKRPRSDRISGEKEAEGMPDEVTAASFMAWLRKELERRRGERRGLELQWLLSANFLAGHQFCDILPGEEDIGDVAEGTGSHSVFNRIAPLYDTRMALLRGVNYRMTVRPATGDADDRDRAEVSTELLAAAGREVGLQRLVAEALSWSELCGSCFFLSFWDVDKGEKRNGIPEGALCCGLLSPYEVFPESVYREEITDQRSIITDQVMTVADIYDRYGVEVEGQSCRQYVITPTGRGDGMGNTVMATRTAEVENSAHVITYYERPSRRYPEGRLAILAGDRLLAYGALPYDGIPIAAMKSKSIPGQFFGRSVITELIPLQRAYNGCKNALHDYIRTAAGEPILLPEGSVEDPEELTTYGLAPNQIILYKPEHGTPSRFTPGGIPAELSAELMRLTSDMEYVAGVSHLTANGAIPGGVTSGTAIANLRQIDNNRLSLTSGNLRSAILTLAGQWLSILKRYADGVRVIRSTGENGVGRAISFMAEDINSFDIAFDTEDSLLYSEEEQKKNFLTACSLGLFNDENGRLPAAVKNRMLAAMKVHGFSDLLDLDGEQRENAAAENSRAFLGEPLSVGEFDDHAVHIAEHIRFILQEKFKKLKEKDPEAAEAFAGHIREHRKLERESATDN